MAVEDGRLYIATQNAGIYEVESDVFKKNTYNNPCNPVINESDKTELSLRGFSVNQANLEGCTWAIAKGDNYLYAACGYKGIAVLDNTMTVLQYIETKGPARDVKVCGNYLFVAEMENGTSIYEINGTNLIQVSNCPVNSNTETAVELGLTKYGNYVFVHTSVSGFDIWDVRDIFNPQQVSTSEYIPGRMDLGTFCNGLVDEKYIGVIGRTTEYWFYEEDGILKLASQAESAHYHESSGSAAIRNYCFASAHIKSYYYYDPMNIGNMSKSTVDNVSFVGLCSSNGSLLTVTRRGNGTLSIFDASDIGSISLISSGTINSFLGAAYFDGEYIYIPCYHDGLVQIVKD